MAEFQYARIAYPGDLDLGQGALDAYFKGWTWADSVESKRAVKTGNMAA